MSWIIEAECAGEMDFDDEIQKDQVAEIVAEIKSRSTRKAYCIKINPDKVPGLFDSKFGGVPYWDMERDYPTDEDGNKMLLLAQINLDGLPPLNNSDGIELPRNGILQFFHKVDDTYGCVFEHLDNGQTYQVVYHSTVNRDITEAQVRALGIKTNEDISDDEDDISPVKKTVAVTIEIAEVSLDVTYDAYWHMFRQIAKEKYGYHIEEYAYYSDYLNEEDAHYFEEMEENLLEDEIVHHSILGYPYFTQLDPRNEGETALQRYDTLLLQIDTERIEDTFDYYVKWGDEGIGNFLINKEDLMRQDFSKILYNWDCS